MSLRTPEKVEKLQAALHAKAKGAPSFQFYALFDKVYREDVLAFAYRVCRHNGGAAGVDGERFEDIESSGMDLWLGALTQEPRLLQRGSTRAQQAASMAVSEAQGAGQGARTLPRCIPAPGAGPDPAPGADAQLSVGERVSPCPKAGCGKSARPV